MEQRTKPDKAPAFQEFMAGGGQGEVAENRQVDKYVNNLTVGGRWGAAACQALREGWLRGALNGELSEEKPALGAQGEKLKGQKPSTTKFRRWHSLLGYWETEGVAGKS